MVLSVVYKYFGLTVVKEQLIDVFPFLSFPCLRICQFADKADQKILSVIYLSCYML